ncbi:MAG: HEPN domain-containing protein [Desulfomonilaceae bacterium]|nr:HEPN domain-containing protein [Desulfomonilaceae bacterium]
MRDLRQARSMIGMAIKDCRALAGMMDFEVFAEEVFGFHVQQSAEKAMKAWLALLGSEYPLTHDLSILLRFLTEAGQDVEQYWDLVEFNAFAVQFRYESFGSPDEPLNRVDALNTVHRLVEHVRNLVDTGSE